MKRILVLVLFLSACTHAPITQPTPSPGPTPSVTASPSPEVTFSPTGTTWPLRGWQPEYSQYVRDHVTPAMINSDPVTIMCPGYTRASGKDIWAAIFQAVTLPESGYNRLSRYVEKGLGIDSETGRQVTSEGLLQLSYDDPINYKLKHCGISWAADKKKADLDPTKTIFDPIINIDCSIEIMDKILTDPDNAGRIVMDALSSYWATMRIGDRLDQSCEFRSTLKKLYPACKTDDSDC